MKYETETIAADDDGTIAVGNLTKLGYDLICVIPTVFQKDGEDRLRVVEFEVIHKPYSVFDHGDDRYNEYNKLKQPGDENAHKDSITPFYKP